MSQHRGMDQYRRSVLAENLTLFLDPTKGVDLKTIAENVGISDRQLQRYRTGQSEPTAVVLYNICQEIEVSFERMMMTETEWMLHIAATAAACI